MNPNFTALSVTPGTFPLDCAPAAVGTSSAAVRPATATATTARRPYLLWCFIRDSPPGNRSAVRTSTALRGRCAQPNAGREKAQIASCDLDASRHRVGGLSEVAVEHLLPRVVRRTGPCDRTLLEDHALARKPERAVHELLDEHDGHAGCRRPLDALEHEVDHERCQAERHLIGDDELRGHRQRAREREHLLLATGERSGALTASFGEAREHVVGVL